MLGEKKNIVKRKERKGKERKERKGKERKERKGTKRKEKIGYPAIGLKL